MTQFDENRRSFLLASGAALTVGLAGCVGGDGDDGGTDNGGDNSTDNGGDNGGSTGAADEVDSYLSENNANNYDGTGDIADETGTDSLTIEVGPGGNFQFDPAAVRIDAGTTVTWEWMSNGHSVQQTDSDLEFEGAGIQNQGSTHEETLDSSGVLLYQCGPHSTLGHHGAIIIE